MKDNRDCSVTFRLKEEEFNWLLSAVRAEEISQSSLIRKMILKSLNEDYPDIKPDEETVEDTTIYEQEDDKNDNRPQWLKELSRQHSKKKKVNSLT